MVGKLKEDLSNRQFTNWKVLEYAGNERWVCLCNCGVKRKGEIPSSLFVLHNCDNRKCINPEHLFLGTNEENMLDMKLKGRACQGTDSHLHKTRRNK